MYSNGYLATALFFQRIGKLNSQRVYYCARVHIFAKVPSKSASELKRFGVIGASHINDIVTKEEFIIVQG